MELLACKICQGISSTHICMSNCFFFCCMIIRAFLGRFVVNLWFILNYDVVLDLSWIYRFIFWPHTYLKFWFIHHNLNHLYFEFKVPFLLHLNCFLKIELCRAGFHSYLCKTGFKINLVFDNLENEQKNIAGVFYLLCWTRNVRELPRVWGCFVNCWGCKLVEGMLIFRIE